MLRTAGRQHLYRRILRRGTLDKWIKKDKLSRGEILLIFRMICKLVGSLHKIQSQIIHFNIKPENILLNKGEDYELKLLDFGIACNPKEGLINDTI